MVVVLLCLFSRNGFENVPDRVLAGVHVILYVRVLLSFYPSGWSHTPTTLTLHVRIPSPVSTQGEWLRGTEEVVVTDSTRVYRQTSQHTDPPRDGDPRHGTTRRFHGSPPSYVPSRRTGYHRVYPEYSCESRTPPRVPSTSLDDSTSGSNWSVPVKRDSKSRVCPLRAVNVVGRPCDYKIVLVQTLKTRLTYLSCEHNHN